MQRRGVVLCLVLALVGWTLPAAAGSYLERAGLLVHQAIVSDRTLAKHLNDRELARLVSRLAEGRLRAARDTLVPKEVALAHPHLLLMLEHYERAASAAAERDVATYYKRQRSARDEEQIFRSVLVQLGWSLPTPQKP
jgi:hypothetical protein